MTGQLALTHVGTPDAPQRIVFLHGLMGRGKNFTTAAKALTPEFYSTLIDLPNHGASPWTDTFSYTEMANSVAAEIRPFVDESGPVNLLGHSMGGKVAMVLALTHPELVDKLIVEDISPQAGGDMGEFVHLLGSLKRLDLSALTSRSQADEQLSEAIGSRTIRGFLLQNLRRSGESFTWQPNLDMLYDNLDVIGDFPTLDTQFAGRVLWMVGEKSQYGDPEFEPAMRALFPRLVRTVIHDANHWIHSEQPEAFVSAIRTFVE